MKLRLYLAIISLFAIAFPAVPQTPRNPGISPSAQHFVCDLGYRQDECDEEMALVRKAVAKYAPSELGEWTWVLVRSDRWERLLRAKRMNPDVPALTDPAGRATFFEEALVGGPPGRIVELMGIWHLGRERLLDFAIRHELGHALCHEPSEKEADRVADLLEKKSPISCRPQVAARRTNNAKSKSLPDHLSDIDRESLHLQF